MSANVTLPGGGASSAPMTNPNRPLLPLLPLILLLRPFLPPLPPLPWLVYELDCFRLLDEGIFRWWL